VEAERRLVEIVGGTMRMVGPNCIGVLNAHPDVSMNATFTPTCLSATRSSRSRAPSV
jgi:acyl-CoA synthetase (NDP forming)